MNKRGIIFFDLDGTLVDSREDLATSVNLVRVYFSLPPLPQEQIISYVGNGIARLIERSFTGSNEDLKKIAFEKMREIYSEHLLDNTKLYDGVEEALNIIRHAKFATAVVSNKMARETRMILEGLNVMKYFDFVLGDGEGVALKPAPDAIFKASRELGVSLSGSWILGDNWTDLECGRRAGIKRAYAAYGFGSPRDEGYDFKAERILSFAEYVKGF